VTVVRQTSGIYPHAGGTRPLPDVNGRVTAVALMTGRAYDGSWGSGGTAQPWRNLNGGRVKTITLTRQPLTSTTAYRTPTLEALLAYSFRQVRLEGHRAFRMRPHAVAPSRRAHTLHTSS
jgi:hypothetical protein